MTVAQPESGPRGLSPVLVALPSAALLGFLVLPSAGLLLRVSSGEVRAALAEPYVQDALLLTLRTSIGAALMCVLLGTPVAWMLARCGFRGKRLVDALVQLPMALPPVVAGMALLMAFGRRGLIGHQLEAVGVEIPFTSAAVVMAQLFVACPFFIQAARAGLETVPRTLEEASRTLGASEFRTFLRVTLPLAWPAFASGFVLAWGRAIGEFGATIMFAGNFQGETQTMTLAVLTAMQEDPDAALALSVLLLLFSIALFVTAGFVLRPARRTAHA